MEIRELAENTLLGSTSEKIPAIGSILPESLTDEFPGKPIAIPRAPSREKKLRFLNSQKKKVIISELKNLEKEKNRALLLHHFANHELLASELMALELLRFPQSPKAFRKRVAFNLLEEKTHLSIYCKRMQELGIELGDIQLNDFFWKYLREMNSSLEFITGMSLTFEQANLDYMLEYQRKFKEIGDWETSSILGRILRDEIGHVRTGMQWFSCFSGEPLEWENYIRSLPKGMSPVRAKGKVFHESIRIHTGFSQQWIQELQYFSFSKGRPPSLFYFHPECEEYYGNSQFTPNKKLQIFQRDLGAMMLFLARREDIVLLSSNPSLAYLETLRKIGIRDIEIISSIESFTLPKGLLGRKLSGLCPWGWSPKSKLFLQILGKNLVGIRNEKLRIFLAEGFSQSHQEGSDFCFSEVFSKLWSSQILSDFLAKKRGSHKKGQETLSLSPIGSVGIPCYSILDIQMEEEKIFHQGGKGIVCKAPFSAAGRKILKIPYKGNQNSWNRISEKETSWLRKILTSQKAVLVEPYFAITLELSIHFEVQSTNEKTRIYGMTRLLVGEKGNYLGNLTGRFWDETPFSIQVQEECRKILHSVAFFTSQRLREMKYFGPSSIDSFLYEDDDEDEAKTNDLNHQRLTYFKPISEINTRYTMGRIALEIHKKIRSNRTGFLRLVSHREVILAGFHSLKEYYLLQIQKHPLRIFHNPMPLIDNGILSITDPESAHSWLLLFCTGESPEECINMVGLSKTDAKRKSLCKKDSIVNID